MQQLLNALLDRPVYLALPVLALALAVLLFPMYRLARKPSPGSTDWMRSIDPPRFTAYRIYALQWMDLLFCAVAGLCAAGLCLGAAALRTSTVFLSVSWLKAAARSLGYPALLGVMAYLLTRLTWGSPLAALCVAALSGLQNFGTEATAFLALSLFFLSFWMTAPGDQPLFFHAFWLVPTALAYSLSVVILPEMLWFFPLYIIAYAVTQCYRWRTGVEGQRGGKLAVSIVLTLLLVLFTAAVVTTLRLMLGGLEPEDFWTVDYYIALPSEMLRFLRSCLHCFAPPTPTLFDATVLLLGLAAWLTAAHGFLFRREIVCLPVLLLPLPVLALWLCGVPYALHLLLPAVLPLGRVWAGLARKRKFATPVLFAAGIAVCLIFTMTF